MVTVIYLVLLFCAFKAGGNYTVLFAVLFTFVYLLIMAEVHDTWGKGDTGKTQNRGSSANTGGTIRCPHCGSPAMKKDDRWECGWCGDFGGLKRK